MAKLLFVPILCSLTRQRLSYPFSSYTVMCKSAICSSLGNAFTTETELTQNMLPFLVGLMVPISLNPAHHSPFLS